MGLNSKMMFINNQLHRLLILLVFVILNIGLQAQDSIPSKKSNAEAIVIDTRPTNELSVYEALQGRISGLDITGSLEAGKDAQAVIRGFNIWGNNTPLIVIDGIPQKSMDHLFNQFNYNNEQIRSLIPVSLEDIESIEVLKDGSVTSIYGAEGANGVILIETRKGRRQKLSVSYEFNQSFGESPKYTPMLSGPEYARYQMEARYNRNRFDPIPPEISYNNDYPGYYNNSANTDWMKEITQPSSASNHYLSFYGGNANNRYYGSVNYLDQSGSIINTGNNRLLGRLNFEHTFTKKLTLGLNLSYLNGKNDGNMIMEDYYGNSKDVLEMAFIKAPNMSIWEYDANGNKTGNYFWPAQNYQGEGRSYYNPVAVSELGNATRTTNDLNATAHLQYKLTNWLRLRETFTYNKVSTDAKANISAIPWGFNQLNINNTTELESEQLRNEVQAFVKIPFKDEKKQLLTGTFSWIWRDENDSIKTNKSNLNLTNLFYQASRNAAVGSIYYKLLDRYILNANARQEWVSLEKQESYENKHYGANLAWQFSNEAFLKNFKVLNTGLIRGGWSYSDYFTEGDFTRFSSVSINNGFINWNNFFETGQSITTSTYSLGLELELINNRIHISTDYYIEQPELNLNNPSNTVTTLEMNNKGWEGALDFQIIRKRHLSWSMQFNIAHNEQSFVNLPSNFTNPTMPENGKFLTFNSNNISLGSIYGLQNEGVYASDADAYVKDRQGNVIVSNGRPLRMIYGDYLFSGGDRKYKDINYDGKINEADVVYLGNVNPTYTGGFGSNIWFRNITLTGNFHFRTGNEIINQTAMDTEGLYVKNNQSRVVLNRWRREGEQSPGLMPRAYLNHPANNIGSDLYVESGSFVRLNYLSLGYKFGSAFCQKILVKDLLLNLSGQNLYTRTSYRGLNPEMELSSFNRDNSRIAAPKIYSVSIKVTI